MRRFILAAVLLAAVLAACQPADGPANAVEAYLEALVAKDETAISNLSCGAWEELALLELDSFQAVETRLEDMSCDAAETAGERATVQCEGSLIATYNEEDQDFSLGDRAYTLILEDGEWHVCGYQ